MNSRARGAVGLVYIHIASDVAAGIAAHDGRQPSIAAFLTRQFAFDKSAQAEAYLDAGGRLLFWCRPVGDLDGQGAVRGP